MYLLFYHFRILPRPACITTCLPHPCFKNQVPGRGIDTAPFFSFTPRHGTPTMPRPSLNKLLDMPYCERSEPRGAKARAKREPAPQAIPRQISYHDEIT
jgi:hypothetical protein